MNKQRSKKDLKNKFQSSAVAMYNDTAASVNDASKSEVSDLIQQHFKSQSDDHDKENIKKSSSTDPMIDDSEVDEIIKQHLMEEEKSQNSKPRKAIKKKAKKKS